MKDYILKNGLVFGASSIILNSASIRSAIVSLTLNTWDGQENVELNLEDIIV